MRSTILIAIIFLTQYDLKSQVLFDSTIIRNAGDVVTVIECDTNNVTTSQGGQNLTFDYSNLVSQYENQVTYLQPTNQPGALNFPKSNCAIKYWNRVAYFKATIDSFIYLGSFDYRTNVDTLNDTYNIGRCDATANLKFDTLYTDTLYFEYFNQLKRRQIINTKVDAFGTLVLPTGSHQNVYRIKTVDNIYQLNQTIPIEYSTTYTFVSKDSPEPLLIIRQASPNNYIQKGKTVKYLKSFSGTSINHFEETELTLYPNPFTNEFNIKGLKSFDQILIYNSQGQLIRSMEANSENITINIGNDLSSGLFNISIRQKNKIVNYKVLCEK